MNVTTKLRRGAYVFTTPSAHYRLEHHIGRTSYEGYWTATILGDSDPIAAMPTRAACVREIDRLEAQDD